MPVLEAEQRRALALGEHLDLLDPALRDHPLEQLPGDDRLLTVEAGEHVAVSLADRDREVRRKRPRRRGPDHEARRRVEFDVEGGRDRVPVRRLEVHEDLRVLPILVLQLGLGEGGLVLDGPVDRLEIPVDHALVDHLREHLEGPGFESRRHREVRIVVVGERQEPLHLALLELDELLRVGRALPSDRDPTGVLVQTRELRRLPLLVELGHDPMLDRQTVAVPTGREGAPHALQEAGPHDEILEHLVEQVSHVDRSVGVGRAVVEAEDRCLGPGFLDGAIEPRLVPPLHAGDLVLREVRPHRKRRRRQVQRVLEGLRLGGWLGHSGIPWRRKPPTIPLSPGQAQSSGISSPGLMVSSRYAWNSACL